MNEEIRAAAYCRFSSEMQRDGYSIEAQRLAISKYCEAKGYRLVAFYVDEARSASKDVMKREQFQRMVGDSSLHAFDVLVVHKLDRFARNRADAAVYRRLLRENGVRIESVLENIQEGPEGIIMEGILDSYAEYYSANLSRETKKGQALEGKRGGKRIEPVVQETAARKVLVDDHPLLFLDSVERALAILRNARLMSPGEYIDLLSPVRLASIMGFLDGISREEIDKIMRRNLEKPQQTPPATQEEERQRDNRDADFADRVSAFFAKVRLNDFARETFS